MTEPFKASNGIEITLETDGGGDVYLVGRRDRHDGSHFDSYANAGPEGIVALREFLQHESDEEIGRWRWSENPEWVAIEGERQDHGRTVVLVNERTLERYWLNDRVMDAAPDASIDKRAARAYFDARPERKPWMEAQLGDVWVISVEGEENIVVHAVAALFGAVEFATVGGKRVNMNNSDFTGFRKIWPEDAS